MDLYLQKLFTQLHPSEATGQAIEGLDIFISNYQKAITLCFIPFTAINSYWIFRKAQLNFSEHIIISGFAFLAVVVISLIYGIVSFIELWIPFSYKISAILSFTTPITFLIIFSIANYQAFKKFYAKRFVFRMLLWFIAIFVEFLVMLQFLVYATNGNISIE